MTEQRPSRPAGRHRSPGSSRGRLLTGAVLAFVLVSGSLVVWALVNEPEPEPRAAGCLHGCGPTSEQTGSSSPPARPSAPAASDSAPAPTPSTSSPEPTGEPTEGRTREGDPRERERGRGGPRLRTDYTTRGDWETNFIGAITVTNRTERPVEAGRLVFGYRRGVRITSAWGVPNERDDDGVVARLGVLEPGASVTVTFQAAGEASSPDHCSLDGRRCG